MSHATPRTDKCSIYCVCMASYGEPCRRLTMESIRVSPSPDCTICLVGCESLPCPSWTSGILPSFPCHFAPAGRQQGTRGANLVALAQTRTRGRRPLIRWESNLTTTYLCRNQLLVTMAIIGFSSHRRPSAAETRLGDPSAASPPADATRSRRPHIFAGTCF